MDEQLKRMATDLIEKLPHSTEPPTRIWRGEHAFPLKGACDRCGWWIQAMQRGNIGYTPTRAAALLEFDLNDSNVALPELRTHLASHFSDVYSVHPRRFEELVADVYRCLGWEVIMTKQSRDGGVDLICLRRHSGDEILVECKRYKAHRRVDVRAVDRLLGASLHFDTRSLHLDLNTSGSRRNVSRTHHFVTSSGFTKPAREVRGRVRKGIKLDLIDGHELLRLLNVYSDPKLAPADLIKGLKT